MHISCFFFPYFLTILAGKPIFDEDGNEVWLIKNTSSLTVDGKTNINTFECVVAHYGRTDTLTCTKTAKAAAGYKVVSKLLIPIENFDCHHRIMTKDLQKTLKSEKFPHMVIEFRSLSTLPSAVGHETLFTGNADIRLAGVTKNFTIQFKSRKINTNNIEMIGTKAILFSDFHLIPPSKLGGTIKVKDQLDVEFKLIMAKIR
ncbi:MAG: YceI family protein [Saprospiraceae bacterium]|nr:YceI family protein [Saprospiraceae bacterium]